jgi:hypothetical protein
MITPNERELFQRSREMRAAPVADETVRSCIAAAEHRATRRNP